MSRDRRLIVTYGKRWKCSQHSVACEHVHKCLDYERRWQAYSTSNGYRPDGLLRSPPPTWIATDGVTDSVDDDIGDLVVPASDEHFDDEEWGNGNEDDNAYVPGEDVDASNELVDQNLFHSLALHPNALPEYYNETSLPDEKVDCYACHCKWSRRFWESILVFCESNVQPYSRESLGCVKCKYWISCDYDIVFLAGGFGIHSSVIFEFDEICRHNTVTFNGFESALRDRYIRNGYDHRLPRDCFREAYFAFWMNRPITGLFYCETCGLRPNAVVADGKTVSFSRSKLLPDDETSGTPWECYDDDGIPVTDRPEQIWAEIRNGGGEKKDGPCTKNWTARGKRTGGVVILWCPHGIAIGFHIMARSEGRRDVYAAIKSHWATAPRLVVYDFACGLDRYCANMTDGRYWENTRFVVDDFHWKNHKCDVTYRMAANVEYYPELRNIKTSMAEIQNATVSRIEKMVAYMSHARAFFLIRHFLTMRNVETRNSMKRIKERDRNLVDAFNENTES